MDALKGLTWLLVAQSIGEALARLALHADECVMIGDRRMDIDGARHHRMRSIGVCWGFGDADELAALLRTKLNVAKEEVMRISPVLGVHTGPGIVGAAVVPMKLMEDLL